MRSLKPLHEKYVQDNLDKTNEYTERVSEITQQVHTLFLLVGSPAVTWYSPTITLEGIERISKGERLNTKGQALYYTLDEVKELVSTCKVDTFLLQSYIKSLILHVKRRVTLVGCIEYYKHCAKIPYTIYRMILDDFNFDNQKYILKGGVLTLGYNIGTLYIREKEKFIDADKPQYNQKAVNWNESWKALEVIAREQEYDDIHNIYTTYKTNIINRKEFVELMKQYTYNAEKRPTLPKWLIYHVNTYNYWLTYQKVSNALPNGHLYSFTPNRLYDERALTKTQFIEQCKSEDDILNSKEYGLQDKITMLLNFNSNYYLNYRR